MIMIMIIIIILLIIIRLILIRILSQAMSDDEIVAILGHELAHAALGAAVECMRI